MGAKTALLVLPETYGFDEDSYAAATAAGFDVVTVLAVLHGHPVHRRFVGSTGLIITGWTPAGQVVGVGLLELPGRDDVYRVGEVAALPPDEAEAARKRLEGEV
jgi:hypothetical protein